MYSLTFRVGVMLQ